MAQQKYPYESQIKKVELVNFAGTRKLDISPQVIQYEFYETIFDSVQKAVLYLYDPIGLFNGFPLIGEEIVLVTFENSVETTTFAYIIEGVDDIKPSKKGREVSYILKLSSLSSLPNLVYRVQKAYNGKISQIVYDLFNEYIVARLIHMSSTSGGIKYAIQESRGNFYHLDVANIEESIGDESGTIVIPNLHPLKAIQWLAKNATPANHERSYQYHFWQSSRGYHFLTAQELCRKDKKRTFKYYSDSIITTKLSQEDQYDAITHLIINNRILTYDKIIDGYFQNGLFEINMALQTYRLTPTTIDDYGQDVENRGWYSKTNTNTFIDTILNTSSRISRSMESLNRVKYAFNNREENDPITPLSQKHLVWGNRVRASTAFNQVDIQIAVQGDTSIHAGDIVELKIPRFEGFNIDEGNTEDKFIVGRYIVSEVKNLITTAGGHHSTVLRLNKDTYYTDPDQAEYEYGDSSPQIITPSHGAPSF